MIIKSAKWGEMVLEDDSAYKDVKLYPGGHRAWDWKETGTRHRPGIQIKDIEELIENGAEVIILSKGYDCVLLTTEEAEVYLNDNMIPYHILQTEEAVEMYNKLVEENNKVGALIHSTC